MPVVSGGSSGSAGLDGWTQASLPWVFSSATAFTIAGADQTATFKVGTFIKLTQSATVKYFVVSSSSFGASTTTVNITGGSDYTLANAAITDTFYSYQVNPQGWPGWFTYDCAPTGFSGTPTQTASRFAVAGRTCTVFLNVTGTSNTTAMAAVLPIAVARVNTPAPVQVTDAGANPTTPGLAFAPVGGTTALTIAKTWNGGASFTASGTKGAQTVFVYEI